ncbi:MAG: NCS2 family permease [Candidatus Treponema excrementipullorum]|uniref:NCS2 family permease n=1 Tax=Candidatus Treponema excrementipullorum TaxID=2838768 RepID=A0A9E2NYH9_9SPIR|nr:NCS2 family permease [Candidatus Treponema excrementipullorum]MCI6479650.1 NCS2 family permease [Spirochaetia bacterium]MCI6954358.1 NCS2 family permease [Spirochaetia bacterium]MCI7590250.1 NCS2 family permease [Spirochaetia bacterium]MDD7011623.1 NCS2 family permease [Candidatus Treponema excrementipullorum]
MEKLFKLHERGTTVRKEVVAGITTFLAMAYILAVNPDMLGATGMNPHGVFTATALSAAIATLVMAFAANLPVALAPGMGLNAFFTYTVVMGMGYSWQVALTAVFLEGIVFILLSFFNVREAIIKAIPNSLKKAVAVGIGLFIALIGLANAGVVASDLGTIIGFAPLQGSPLVAVIGLIITIVLYTLKVPGAILIAILITTVIGIPFGVTVVPENFNPVSLPSSPIFFAFDFSSVFTLKFFTVFFTFFFVDIFDTVGTLVGVATQAKLTDKEGNIPNVKQAFLADAIGTVVGAALGTSTVTSFVESSAGVAAGGRTGLSSVVTAILFLLALFLTPLFLLIPSAATAPALIFVGYLMMKSVTGINFEDPVEGIPAFITILVMPFAYSIAEGIVWGVLAYVLLNVITGRIKKISVITWILFVIFILRFFLK